MDKEYEVDINTLLRISHYNMDKPVDDKVVVSLAEYFDYNILRERLEAKPNLSPQESMVLDAINLSLFSKNKELESRCRSIIQLNITYKTGSIK